LGTLLDARLTNVMLTKSVRFQSMQLYHPVCFTHIALFPSPLQTSYYTH